jgi:hypothetical protein
MFGADDDRRECLPSAARTGVACGAIVRSPSCPSSLSPSTMPHLPRASAAYGGPAAIVPNLTRTMDGTAVLIVPPLPT